MGAYILFSVLGSGCLSRARDGNSIIVLAYSVFLLFDLLLLLGRGFLFFLLTHNRSASITNEATNALLDVLAPLLASERQRLKRLKVAIEEGFWQGAHILASLKLG